MVLHFTILRKGQSVAAGILGLIFSNVIDNDNATGIDTCLMTPAGPLQGDKQ
ncbi:hypothetical protein RSK20926_13934 [Roseobacter sp. SK209-2-6]|nr:hypothetical protein RSK20926_13934 [Roseobacter sp. SK209-2-6]